MAADSKSNDDIKAKMRAALDKKKGADHDHPLDDVTGSGPSHEESAKTQRMFRRKSG